MKVIYVDCSSGISGSALLGALVELGATPSLLVEKIKSIIDISFQLTFSKRITNGSAATTTIIKADTGHEAVPVAARIKSITGNLAGDKLGDRLNSLFDKIIQARARISCLPVTEVTMAETEIMKILIMATGFFTALDQLEIGKINASPLPLDLQPCDNSSTPLLLELARGTVVKQHEGQNTPATPLGMALLACLVDEYGPLPEILLEQTGYGISYDNSPADTRVRILYGKELNKEAPSRKTETVTVVETAIDDMNPEFFPFLVARLLAGGALDAFITPIYMKKGRPAQLLTVLCSRSRLEELLKIIFKESTTLGVRIREEKRRILPRVLFKVNTSYGKVTVKAGYLKEGGPPVHYAPEFEDCKALASQLGVPIQEIYAAAQRAASEYINMHSQKP